MHEMCARDRVMCWLAGLARRHFRWLMWQTFRWLRNAWGRGWGSWKKGVWTCFGSPGCMPPCGLSWRDRKSLFTCEARLCHDEENLLKWSKRIWIVSRMFAMLIVKVGEEFDETRNPHHVSQQEKPSNTRWHCELYKSWLGVPELI